jgi:serine/threonine kinase 16
MSSLSPLPLPLLIDRIKFYSTDFLLTLTHHICSCLGLTRTHPTLHLNGRTYALELVAEGGFSYVYAATDTQTGRVVALKKVVVPGGSGGGSGGAGADRALKDAFKEVEASRRFRHGNIIRVLDSAVVQDEDGGGKILYL